MRFQITAELATHACKVFGPESFELHPYQIMVQRDAEERPLKIAIQLPVDSYDEYLPVFKTGTPHQIHIPANPYYQPMIGLLQYLESVGSFWFQIKEVKWQSATQEWIPENEEEKRKCKLFSFTFDSKYDTAPVRAETLAFRGLLELRPKLEYLTVPMSFYRVGLAEYLDKRNLMAYLNFYLFLEGLFSMGKSRQRPAEEAFGASKTLSQAIARVLPFLDAPPHTATVRRWFENLGCTMDRTGVSNFLVRMRGRLSHYYLGDSRDKAHPLNDREFQSIAYVAYSVATSVVALIVTGDPLEWEPDTPAPAGS